MKPRTLCLGLAVVATLACGAFSTRGQDKSPQLRVVAELFHLDGRAYLKLSLENPGETSALLTTDTAPAWTANHLFRVKIAGATARETIRGASSPCSPLTLELPRKSRQYFGVACLTGKDSPDEPIYQGYSEVFDLAPGVYDVEVSAFDLAAEPAKLKLAIPKEVEPRAGSTLPKEKAPLSFLVSKSSKNAVVRLEVHVANGSTDTLRYPYRGETRPQGRINWYRLEVDGKIVAPVEHSDDDDAAGEHKIEPMNQWWAQTIVIVSDQIKDRKLVSRGGDPLYELPEGERTVRVIPSPLWAEKGLPVPSPGSARIRVLAPPK